MKITIDICTRNRYEILCDTLLAILNQTYLSSICELIIYDDTPIQWRRDMRTFTLYSHIFDELKKNNIGWHVVFGKNEGQVLGHQWIKDNAKNDWIWRLDDDEIPDKDVLKGLINTIKNEKSIVSCLIPYHLSYQHNYNGTNKIDNYKQYNSQWIWGSNTNQIDKCEHLYSSFLYNRKYTLDYCFELSPVGHGEETIFTYRNFIHGSELLVNRKYTIWHKRYIAGGIRSENINTKENFVHDEQITNRIIDNLKNWKKEKIFPILGGIGDNYAFRMSFEDDIDKLKNKFGEVLFAVSFKEVYTDMDVKIISVQDAKDILGDRIVNNLNVYTFMANKNWNKSLREAYKEMFNI